MAVGDPPIEATVGEHYRPGYFVDATSGGRVTAGSCGVWHARGSVSAEARAAMLPGSTVMPEFDPFWNECTSVSWFSARCVLSAGGRVVISASGQAAASSDDLSLADGSLVATVIDDAGIVHSAESLPLDGRVWELRVDVSLPAGAYTVVVECRADAAAVGVPGAQSVVAAAEVDIAVAPGPMPGCSGDADGNGEVSFADVRTVLATYSNDYGPLTGYGDANGDGIVNFKDVWVVLANFGTVCG